MTVSDNETQQPVPTFAELGLSKKVLSAVEEAGYTTPTPIQAGAIPHALERKDVLGIAQTGTGKTASFTLPMLTLLEKGRARARMPRTLILEPTRELAAQVEENFEKYGKNHRRLNVALLIGGVSFDEQEKKLERGADVLIATPGRLLDHFERGKLLLTGVEILVIDEADRMLDMGFIPDIERICKLIPFTRQTLFFSATMPPEIQRLTEQFLQAPVKVEVSKASSTSATIEQKIVAVGKKDYDQRAKLRELIDAEGDDLKNAIIFCNRKVEVSTLFRSLIKHGYDAGALHGDMDQRARMATLEAFRNGKLRLLVASDVAARGLDIPDVSHVFNFDIPRQAEDYVHRIGRTGRAGRLGKSFTLVSKSDEKYLDSVIKLIEKDVEWVGGDLSSLDDEGPDDRKGGRSRSSGRKRNSRGSDRTKASDKAEVSAAADDSQKQPVQDAPEPSDDGNEANASEKPKVDDTRSSRSRSKKKPETGAKSASSKSGSQNDSRRGRKKDDMGDAPRGFGDEVPAFMMNGLA